MQRSITLGFVSLVLVSSSLFAKNTANIPFNKGALIGVVNLLDPEVMHYHAASEIQDTFLKTQPVTWSVDDMLASALQAQLGQKNLTFVPVAASDQLLRSRESCFVNAPLIKGLPKGCVPVLAQVAADAGVDGLIVMAPGINNSDHTENSRTNGQSEMLRGWGFVTSKRAGAKDKPTIFNETELLLIAITPAGPTLRARQWGGTYTLKWETYTPPPNLKDFPPDQLDALQSSFATILSRQAKDLLDQVSVSP